ncbi:hypothetical protein CH330_05755 [candidate division WOR-3 bacterium JGI_Cruoil_03_51_56]|mgnify:CR=1 FL=1|uniref:FlgD/Vpr Ig-like domain-containing protein n=1 Tax=candidate division WOR-3 bacterium JGI_Cruoil_03_51_56 TaxID=1973747 RepID=A0A235BT38_UNCW3|nr:MAG: hypothetical protein CH330_05755 [candidate division WOR-3 bacterium JGI_Cruoil_03_51_56]
MKNRTSGLLPILLAVCLLAAAGFGQFVEDSIDVGRWVGSLAFNSRTGVIYGGSQSDNIFFAISCDSNKIVSRFYQSWPRYLAYSSTSNKAYCTFQCGGEDSVAVIDGSTHTRIKAIPLNWAIYPVWDPASNRLYVSCLDENRVSVIDCRTDSVICHIRVGREPLKMHLNTRHHKLYVQNWGDWQGESVSIIDLETNEVIRTIRLDEVPTCGYYCSAVDKYYCDGGLEVVVIDGESDSVLCYIPMRALAMAGNETDTLVMIGTSIGSVFVIDAVGDSVVSVLPVGREPSSLAWSQATNLVYCANASSDNVSVIAGDGSRVVKTLAVGDCPAVLLSVPEFRRAYVGHSNTRWVYVIRDTTSGVAEDLRIPVRPVSLLRAFPNPFGGNVSIEYSGQDARSVTLSIYSRNGRLVRQLTLNSAGAHHNEIVWDGRDQKGILAPQGVYTILIDGIPTDRVNVVKLR